MQAPSRSQRHAQATTPLVMLALAWLIAPASIIAAPPVSAGDRILATGESEANEYTLKAAFLYNFAKYTTWPKSSFAESGSPIVIAVVGKDPFGKILDGTLAGKKVGKRHFKVQRINDPKKVKTAHILFLGDMPLKARSALLSRLKGKAILVVADEPGVAGKGAVAGFVLERGKLRFEICTKTVKANGLSISSQLLKLAKPVKSK